MNILIFTASFHPYIGGLENHTLSLLYEFLRAGCKVKVIAIQFQTTTPTSATPKLAGVDVYYRPGFFKTLQLYQWCHIMFMPNITLRGIWLLPFNPFKKLVISHNDSYLTDKTNYKTRLKLQFIKLASHNISVSQSVADSIGTKSTVIYNCYDNAVFKLHTEEKRIYDFVFLGRLVTQKGCDLLIRALKNTAQPFKLNIIGNGPERANLESLIAELGLQQEIKFLGVLEGEALARTLNRHKTMVIPSLEVEGFGIVALEGMACGCNIIAANAGGLTEAVKGFGETFEMGNQQELERLISNQLNIPTGPDAGISIDLERYLYAHSRQTIAADYLKIFQR